MIREIVVLPVVGVTFVDGYPNNIKWVDQQLRSDIVPNVELRPNPNNRHDPLAIEVRLAETGQMLGHLAQRDNRIINPILSEIVEVEVDQVRHHPDRPEAPYGLSIKLRREVPK
jgi:hypothetical protein